MKKVIIIGGGISGLTAGIYALQNGFDVDIYEKNAMMGGECTGWSRQGYHIDNCLHWLTGCRPSDDLNKIWKNIGALSDDTELYYEPYFYMLEMDGRKLHFWRDLEKARAEFLSISPEDKKEINKFFDNVRNAESIHVPCEKSLAEMNIFEFMRFGMSMSAAGKMMNEYGKDSIDDLAKRFKNPVVRAIMSKYFDGSYKAITLISSYAFYTGNTGALPMGGSTGMIKRIVGRFESLGGTVHTGMSAENIEIKNGKAVSVSFSDGSSVPCDYVICACDASVTFGKLIDRKYMDKNMRSMYEETDKYQAVSGFHVSFGIKGNIDCGFSGSVIFPCESIRIGTQDKDFMGVRLYDYDSELFPSDRRVIQCNTLQNENDYAFWEALYQDRESYNAEKQRIARETEARVVAQYPHLEGQLIPLCTYSPVTFNKWCNAYKGAYMSFFEKVGAKSLTARNTLKGLGNVFIGGQWVNTNGGLPTAAASGRFAADALAAYDKKHK